MRPKPADRREGTAPIGSLEPGFDRRLRRAELLGHRPLPLASVLQRAIALPTAEEEAILGTMTTFLRNYRNRLAAPPPPATLPNVLTAGERILNAIQDVVTHSTAPAVPGQTLQAYVNATAFNLGGVALVNTRTALNARIFTDANTTFQQVPQLSPHLQPLLNAAWAIHLAYEQGTTVAEQAAGGEDVGRDYTAGGAAPACLAVNLGAPPTLAAITANAGVAADVSRVQSDATSRITWHFPDGTSIAVDIPGGGNETYQVSYLPHIHLMAADGTPLTRAGIGVPKASEPAHVLLHWTNFELTQSLQAMSGQQDLILPSHLRLIGRYP